MLGKKGTASELWAPDTILFWIVFGIVLGFVAIIFVLIVSKAGSEQAKINENLESLNLMQKFTKSTECFVYEKNEVVFQNTIDSGKFSQQTLDKCYLGNDKELPAFRLTLNSRTANILDIVKTANWNDNLQAEQKKQPKEILVYSQNKFHDGELIMEVQNA